MLENLIAVLLDWLIPLFELIGVTVLTIAVFRSFYHYLRRLLFRADDDVRHVLAAGMALSLEFKMAAEILKTVLVRDLHELLILGVVILLRAMLSVLIHLEMKQPDPEK